MSYFTTSGRVMNKVVSRNTIESFIMTIFTVSVELGNFLRQAFCVTHELSKTLRAKTVSMNLLADILEVI